MQGCWIFLEENEVEPSSQQQIAIAQRIAFPGVLSLLIKDPSAESIAINAKTISRRMEGRLAWCHLEDRLRYVLHPQYFYLIIATLSDCLEIFIHQLVEYTRLTVAHPQNQGLNLVVSNHWRWDYDRRDGWSRLRRF